MSMATLERAILAGLREVVQNPKLRLKDMREWSTSLITPHEGEVVVFVPDPGVYVAIECTHDKRERAEDADRA